MPWPPLPDRRRQYLQGIQVHPWVAPELLADVAKGMIGQSAAPTGGLGYEGIEKDVAEWRGRVEKGFAADAREAVPHIEASLSPEALRRTVGMGAVAEAVAPTSAVVEMDTRKAPALRQADRRWMAVGASGRAE